MSMWGWVLTLIVTINYAFFSTEFTCLSHEVYTIGVLQIDLEEKAPTYNTRWCSELMLCGMSSGMSLHVETLVTTVRGSVNVIEHHRFTSMWLLSHSHHMDSNSTQIPRSFLRSRNIPFLDYTQRKLPETDADWCRLILKYVYRKPSDHDLYVDYVISVVNQTDISTLVIAYDESTEMEVAELSDRLSDRKILHELHLATPGESLWSVVNRKHVVDFEDYTDFLVWCNISCITHFLEHVTSIAHGNNSDILWQHLMRIFLVDTTLHEITGPRGLFNQSGLHAEPAENLTQPTHASFFNSYTRYSDTTEGILHLVRYLYHVVVLWKADDCVYLNTLLKTADGGRCFSHAGFGNSNGHMLMTSEVFPNTKWRLNQDKFIVATQIWEPFVMLDNSTGTPHYTGMCMDMLEVLAMSLNFTYEIVSPADGEYGNNVNGTWTGLVGMLVQKQAHMVVAPIAVNEARAQVVDFTTPFYLDYTGILIQKPDPDLHKWKTYFMPFSSMVFLCISLAFLLAAVFGHVVGVKSAEVIFPDRRQDGGILDTIQYFFGSLLAQGGVWNPVTGSARMFVSAWWLFCVVVAAIYSGNLTASFAVTSFSTYSKLKDLLEEDSYDFGTVPGTIWIDIFKFSNRSEFKKIDKKMAEFTKEHQDILEASDHVRRTSTSKYAYISNKASLDITVREECDLMILEEVFLPLQYAVALQKESPLTDAISKRILLMSEGGLDQMWSSDWWTNETRNKCGKKEKTTVKELYLKDCQSAFYVLVLGFILACMAVVAEAAIHRYLIPKHEMTGSRESVILRGAAKPSENGSVSGHTHSRHRTNGNAQGKLWWIYSGDADAMRGLEGFTNVSDLDDGEIISTLSSGEHDHNKERNGAVYLP